MFFLPAQPNKHFTNIWKVIFYLDIKKSSDNNFTPI